MSGLQIIKKNVSDLIPYCNNARTHSAEQITQIAASIKEFGFNNPVLLDGDNGIIAGHGRVMAAKKLGLTEISCIELKHLSEAQKKAYILADNKIAMSSGWDDELLKVEMEALKDVDFDLEITGFSIDELSELICNKENEGLTDPDDVPEAPEEPKTKLGDIYKLGNHRLMCGDSTDKACVEKLMDGNKADMVFTSPPYNANAAFSTFSNNTGKLYADGYKDNMSSEKYILFCEKVLDICFLFTDGFVFWNVNYNANSRFEYLSQIQSKLSFLIEQICWKKTSVIPYHAGLRRTWEPVFVFRTDPKHGNIGTDGHVQDNLWEISNTNIQLDNHRGCFPCELPEMAIGLIKAMSRIVFEPFGGSGSTLIACEKLNRHCYMMELDLKYCDVIVKRWEDYTGKNAELANV